MITHKTMWPTFQFLMMMFDEIMIIYLHKCKQYKHTHTHKQTSTLQSYNLFIKYRWMSWIEWDSAILSGIHMTTTNENRNHKSLNSIDQMDKNINRFGYSIPFPLKKGRCVYNLSHKPLLDISLL